MKKTISIVTVLILLFSMLTIPALANKDNASYGDVPKSADAITIDGEKDAVYDKGLKLEVDLDALDSGCPTTATAWLLWQDGFIYIFGEVKDSYIMPQDKYVDESAQPWMTDSLEAFIEWDNSGTSEFDQFRVDAYGWRSFEHLQRSETSYGQEENAADGVFEGKAKIVDSNKYNVEFKIPIQDGKGAGDAVGLVFQLNDHDEDDTHRTIWSRASASDGTALSWVSSLADYIVLSATQVTAVEVPAETEAPATEAPAENDVAVNVALAPVSAAPVTGDTGLILAIFALIGSASVLVLKSRKNRA